MSKKRKFLDIYSKIQKEELKKERQEEVTFQEKIIKQERKKTEVIESPLVVKEIEELLEKGPVEKGLEEEGEWSIDLKPLKRDFIPFKNKRKILKWSLLFIGICIIGLIFYLVSTVFSKAEITIKRKRIPNEINLEIIFDKNIKEINPEKLTLPMNLYVFSKEVSQNFQSSGFGKDEKKATGEVTIYNKTLYPQVLVANTRLETPDGKIFRINSRITVPGGVKENENIIPGSISVKVTADQPGPDYNIKPCNESTNCKFKIVGFKGTEKYDLFYAYSEKEMTGGAFGTIPIVTNEDLKKAEDVILNEITKIIDEEIKNKVPPELKIIEGAISGFKLTNLQSDAKAGDNRQFFNVSAQGERIVSAFNERDVKGLLTQYYQNDLEENRAFCDDFELNYSLKEIDFKAGTMRVKINGKYFLCPKIYAPRIIDLIQGKSISETIKFFNSLEDLEKAEIKIMPFWVKRIPSNQKNIIINID